ncbi:hypothetical protein J6590_044493 [Homalodisca vitripennis]|nr:hypothetical protein J6590_044493 [Homalodisca vitripennis]
MDRCETIHNDILTLDFTAAETVDIYAMERDSANSGVYFKTNVRENKSDIRKRRVFLYGLCDIVLMDKTDRKSLVIMTVRLKTKDDRESDVWKWLLPPVTTRCAPLNQLWLYNSAAGEIAPSITPECPCTHLHQPN